MEADPSLTALAEVELPVGLAEQLTRWARAGAPREACGALVGRRDGERLVVREARRGRNLAERPDRFELDPGELVSWELAAAVRGDELVAIWHSHPHGPAELSGLDQRARLGGWAQVVVAPGAAESWQLGWYAFEDGAWREAR